MAEKKLLLGDEAIALGAIHAGISGVYAYPGTPSTEITEFIQNNPLAKERKLHSTWCTNEKTAMEAALGMSYAGKRALVCMKHVGMNVAADAFVNSATVVWWCWLPMTLPCTRHRTSRIHVFMENLL
jgi:indolepyruvate ferredoxin oxidoreductase alpha subunit